MALLSAVPAYADPWNKKTTVSTSGRLEIPGGVVLEPGKYVFKLADSMSNRHIVQVFNEDENRVFATILAIPNYRTQVTSDTVITTWETPVGQPPALRAWFYPGDNFGQEFPYPKERAMEISRASGEEVLTLASADTHAQPSVVERDAEIAETPSPRVEDEAIDETPARSSVDDDIREPDVEDEPTLMAQNRPQTPPDPGAAAPPAQAPSELPQTGSPAPLLGLLGLASLGAAAALRSTRRRR
jgi:LPXTG-motif cell wall-anchored protein